MEVDILTGEMYVVRTDILEDAGLSTSPIVDIGQVEGAFIMGLGLFTSEEIKHDLETGELLTKNTWEYKPPAAKDIPQDFRVSLLKNARNPLGVMSSKGCCSQLVLTGENLSFSHWRARHVDVHQRVVRHQVRPGVRQEGGGTDRLVAVQRPGHGGEDPAARRGEAGTLRILRTYFGSYYSLFYFYGNIQGKNIIFFFLFVHIR